MTMEPLSFNKVTKLFQHKAFERIHCACNIYHVSINEFPLYRDNHCFNMDIELHEFVLMFIILYCRDFIEWIFIHTILYRDNNCFDMEIELYEFVLMFIIETLLMDIDTYNSSLDFLVSEFSILCFFLHLL